MTLRSHPVARVASRVLLAAGFAGGAWLLASSAAHAAAPNGAAAGANRAVIPTIRTTGTAVRLLDQVLAPTDRAVTRPAHHQVRSAAAPVNGHTAHGAGAPRSPRGASQAVPVEPHFQPVRNGADAVTGSLLRSTAPVLQLFPPALGTVVDRTATALPDVLAPVAGGLRIALAPTQHPDRVASAGSDDGRTAWVGRAAPGQDPQVTRGAPGRSGTGSAARPVRAARPAGNTDTSQVPGSPERTPAPAYPDSGNTGVSTTASGSHHDGGASAIVPAPVAGGQSADLRRPRAAQVAVRPLLAEVPTVAPD